MENELVVLLTSDNADTIEYMAFMYAHNALLNKWWDKVTLLIWGASSKTILAKQNLCEMLEKMQEDGVTLKACKACAEKLGTYEGLLNLGFEVDYMGLPLTTYLKNEKVKVLTV